MRLRCGSLSVTTPVSLLTNELDVRSALQGQVHLAGDTQICVIHEALNGYKNLKVHLIVASKMLINFTCMPVNCYQSVFTGSELLCVRGQGV